MYTVSPCSFGLHYGKALRKSSRLFVGRDPGPVLAPTLRDHMSSPSMRNVMEPRFRALTAELDDNLGYGARFNQRMRFIDFSN